MEQPTLFESGTAQARAPLAERMRPTTFDGYAGLDALDPHLVAQIRTGKGRPPSLILWGPPGSGKTTLAKLIGGAYGGKFIELSAVSAGVKEVREVADDARYHATPPILFLDEIHRFTKAQQDGLLPHVERGVFSLIGATTENPSFALTGALLSRARVIVLQPHTAESLAKLITRGGEEVGCRFNNRALEILIEVSGGDARRALGLVEQIAGSGFSGAISGEEVEKILKASQVAVYDRNGEQHYDMVSAFIKSMRGSDADGALYWAFRMIESGEDPRFIIRRMMIFASEDIGNADPRGLELAVATSTAYEKLGLPEGKIPIAHCITYLATCPKSNRSYLAMHRAIAEIEKLPRVAVPLHLRNAPTKLMKNLGYGQGYQYPHDHAGGVVAGVRYLPDEVTGGFYEPSDRGYEKVIGERGLGAKGKK
jgi:putative ATPase